MSRNGSSENPLKSNSAFQGTLKWMYARPEYLFCSCLVMYDQVSIGVSSEKSVTSKIQFKMFLY